MSNPRLKPNGAKALTLNEILDNLPDIDWQQAPLWVMNSVGELQPAQTCHMLFDASGNRLLVLTTNPTP